MNSKKCGKCRSLKPLTEFYIRKSGNRSGQYYEQCIKCYRKRGREYYQQTRERQLELVKLRVKRYIKDRLSFMAKAKNKPCADCKKYYPPWVMDFDHINPSTKLGHVSKMFLRRMWTIEKVKQEINKCEIVCSNCHRNRTYMNGKRNYEEVVKEVEQNGYKFMWKNRQGEVAKVVTARV